MGIQIDYGGFNPSFLGATIKFSNARTWHIFNGLMMSGKWTPAPSMTEEEKFEEFCAISTLQHEVRHFHDFLLSPYSAQVFVRRIQAVTNGVQLVGAFLSDHQANCLPIPVFYWTRLNSEQRKSALRFAPSSIKGAPRKVVKIPTINDGTPKKDGKSGFVSFSDFTEEDLRRFISILREQYQWVEELLVNPNAIQGKVSFQPWQVMELSAIATQLQEIWNLTSEPDASFYLSYLCNKEINAYGILLKLMSRLWQKSGAFETMPSALAMSSIALWSLLGSYEQDEWKACPSERFSALFALVLKEGIPRDFDDPMGLFDHWSKETQLSSIQQGLSEGLSVLRSFKDSFKTRYTKAKRSNPVFDFDNTLRNLEALITAKDKMIDTFLDAPLTYIDPYQYIDNISNFVDPLLRLTFEGGHIKESKDYFKRNGFTVLWSHEKNGETYVTDVVKPAGISKIRVFDIDSVIGLFSEINLSDLVFSEKTRSARDKTVAAHLFSNNFRIQTLEIPVEELS